MTPADDSLTAGRGWHQMLNRTSFVELDALGRTTALLDPGSVLVLAGPFARLESPWLAPQGITPQADDGTVIARGTVSGRPVVVCAIEQGFQGGGTGEVSGAKISQSLALAAADSRSGHPVAAIILFETGGVRLQEANLGLNAVAEICSALLDLRPLAPVIGVVAGSLGSFGGMSIAAGLCTQLIVTPQARIGLNGPAVIEQEAGTEELDPTDHAAVWALDGGQQRRRTGLADVLVADDADQLRAAVAVAVTSGVRPPGRHRSQDLATLAARLAVLDPTRPPSPLQLRTLWGQTYGAPPPGAVMPAAPARDPGGDSRGRTWLTALSGVTEPDVVIPSVLQVTTDDVVYLAVVPDPDNPYHRARGGEVGLTEALALGRAVTEVVEADRALDRKRAVVAVVDVPSQAYGRIEEMAGLHQAMATAVDAYHHARTVGHPIVTVVVGTALSGGFLTHGFQADQILALDDPGVEIHAMHREAAARITLRTVDQLDDLARSVLPLSYDVRDWARLGLCDGLLPVDDGDHPTGADIANVRCAISEAIERARHGPRDLSQRLDSPGAVEHRGGSRAVRELLAREWPAPS